MGFGFQTPISWQAEMWVLQNLPMGVAKRRGGIATQKGGVGLCRVYGTHSAT